MHLVQIPPDAVINGENTLQIMWPMIEPLLQRGIEHSEGMATFEGQVEAIRNKQHQLWIVAANGAKIMSIFVTKLEKFSTGITQCTIILAAGETPGGLESVIDMLPELEKWAKVEGCNRVWFFARRGWAKKLPDYRLASYVMSKELS